LGTKSNLIIGLGNPGIKYIRTRHNIGFRIVDKLAQTHGAKLKKKLFYNAKEARISGFRNDPLLVQPLTFMNLSGRCVLKYKNRFKLSLDNILIVCDDINLPLGEIRIRAQGSPGGHNGLESVITSLGAKDFPRLRIGIRPEGQTGDLSDFVLSDFKDNEIPEIVKSIERSVDACECWLRYGITKAMNLYNR